MERIMAMRYQVLFLLFACIAIFSAATIYAQQLDPRFEADLALDFSPTHPAPGDTVRITARSVLLDLEGTNLIWYVDGTETAEGIGHTSMEVAAGPLGSETLIVVGAYDGDTELIAQSAEIRPTELDLLWESNSYVPPTFHGRALPSAGTSLRLEAIPRFVRADGSRVPISDITFTWRRNNYVMQDVSGRGKSRAVIESPSLFGQDVISVEAKTSDGLFERVASVQIPSVEPHLVLYEKHPLFGVMYHRALSSGTSLPEVETSLVAVPYFADAANPNDGSLLYEWRVNGNSITSDAARPSEITINASGSSGLARIELVLSHITNFFFGASGAWTITLLGENGGGFFDAPSAGTQ